MWFSTNVESHRYLQSTASRSGQRFIIWTPLRQKNALFILFEQLEWKAHFLPKLFVGIEGLLWSMRFSLDLLGLWRAHLCYLADVPSIKASHKKNFCPKRHPGVLGRKKIANYFYFKTLAIGNDVFGLFWRLEIIKLAKLKAKSEAQFQKWGPQSYPHLGLFDLRFCYS